MVEPGVYPLAITRGIEFEALVIQCKDEDVVITGTLSPDVTGTFVSSGFFGGYQLYILAGAPSTFLYYNATETSYVIARTLTTGALTDYWVPAAPITEPTGTYAPQGANTGTATATDHPVDLTDYDVEAKVRRTVNSTDIYLDLTPSITDPTAGEITIPAISSTNTDALEYTGSFMWDLVLTNSGSRFGPYLKGPFVVSDNVTQP
jgi:hypothetical protein